MKRYLLLLLCLLTGNGALAGSDRYALYHPRMPEPRIVEAVEPPAMQGNVSTSGLNVFSALQTFNAGITSAGPNTLGGATSSTSSLTAGKLNGIFMPDGTQYTSILNAMNACPVAGTIGCDLLIPPNTGQLRSRFGVITDGGTALPLLVPNSFIHVYDFSRFYDLDSPGLNNGYSHAPRFWIFGQDSGVGSGHSNEFEIGSPQHVSVTLNSLAGTERLIDPTTGCVGNGASTTCTIAVGEPNIVWGTNRVCVMGYAAGNVLNGCFNLTASTTTTFTFASSLNGTQLGTTSTWANLATNTTQNRLGLVFRKGDPITTWELGTGLNSQDGAGAQSFSLQNYTASQSGSTYWLVDPYTGTFCLNQNSCDNTQTMQLFARVNTAVQLKLMGNSSGATSSQIIMDNNGAAGTFFNILDAGVLDAFMDWNGSGNKQLQIGTNISGGRTQLFSGGDALALEADSTQKILIPKGLMATGTAATLTGTGACATITTQVGGAWAGSAKCTGATAASTLTIQPGPTATNGWICNVQDQTTRANLFQQTSFTTAACVLTITSVTQNDVFVFSAIAF